MTMEFKSQSYMLIDTWSEMTGAERMEGRTNLYLKRHIESDKIYNGEKGIK